MIFVMDSGPNRPHENNPIWSQLSAVKNGRVIYVGDEWVETNGRSPSELVLREAAHYSTADLPGCRHQGRGGQTHSCQPAAMTAVSGAGPLRADGARAVVLIAALLAVSAAVIAAGLTFGTKRFRPSGSACRALRPDGKLDSILVWTLRLPRSLAAFTAARVWLSRAIFCRP